MYVLNTSKIQISFFPTMRWRYGFARWQRSIYINHYTIKFACFSL